MIFSENRFPPIKSGAGLFWIIRALTPVFAGYALLAAGLGGFDPAGKFLPAPGGDECQAPVILVGRHQRKAELVLDAATAHGGAADRHAGELAPKGCVQRRAAGADDEDRRALVGEAQHLENMHV